MLKSKYFWITLITAVVIGALLGVLLILMPTELLMKIVFVIMGMIIVATSVPALVFGASHMNERFGKTSFVFALLSLVLGVVMIFWHNSLLSLVLGAFLIAFPIVNIVMAEEHLQQLKKELPKMIVGVVLLLVGPAKTLEILFDVAGWSVIALTVAWALYTVISTAVRESKTVHQTGNRTFVDRNGDGTIDAVFVDTTGDCRPDPEVDYKDPS